MTAHFVGYAWIVREFKLPTTPLRVISHVRTNSARLTLERDGVREEYYSMRYDRGESVFDHLEFALKHEGVNLQVLAALFAQLNPIELLSMLKLKPRSIYLRRLWFFYEWLTNRQIDIPDVKNGNYVPALDTSQYCTIAGVRSRRHHVINNMPGGRNFCPLVRRTALLEEFLASNLQERARQVVQNYTPELIGRAVDYLYTKETKSSFEIEHELPASNRRQRFVALLRRAHQQLFNTKAALLELQNAIVDSGFAVADYRHDQSYVGETSLRGERIHYICPKPDDVPQLMAGLLDLWEKVDLSKLHPVVAAALVSFGFVFIHPFDDGNGRIHRFLIHNILARQAFTPNHVIFPVSAAMVRQIAEYNRILESVSRPINQCIEYELDIRGRMTVNSETAFYYRYLDLTEICEQLFRFVQDTVEIDLVEELKALTSTDAAKDAIQDVVDMPDALIYLFIRLVLQNGGRLSNNKRAQFSQLSNQQIIAMEESVRDAFNIEASGAPPLTI